MAAKKEEHVGHSDTNLAYHVPWGFRREALFWEGDIPVGVNIHPFAGELRGWLRQNGAFTLIAPDPGAHPEEVNPYTYQTSVLTAILARSIDAAYEFWTRSLDEPQLEADVERIRLYNEQILYIARFCEASIKQLLFATSIWKPRLATSTLAPLLSTECLGCKGSGKKRHMVSYLGSLAHAYHLCIPFEQCLFEHLKLVGRRRNIEAAHSETQLLVDRPVPETRKKLEEDSIAAGTELVHMLEHISDLEHLMIQELTGIVLRGHNPLPASSVPSA